jgi:hypothetical protein
VTSSSASPNLFGTSIPAAAFPAASGAAGPFGASVPGVAFAQPASVPPAAAAQTDETKIIFDLLAKRGLTNITEEDLEKLRAGDEYETEIMLMSGVRAYFQASHPSLVDLCSHPDLTCSRTPGAFTGCVQGMFTIFFKRSSVTRQLCFSVSSTTSPG